MLDKRRDDRRRREFARKAKLIPVPVSSLPKFRWFARRDDMWRCIRGNPIEAFRYEAGRYTEWFAHRGILLDPYGTADFALCCAANGSCTYPGCWIVRDKEQNYHALHSECFRLTFKLVGNGDPRFSVNENDVNWATFRDKDERADVRHDLLHVGPMASALLISPLNGLPIPLTPIELANVPRDAFLPGGRYYATHRDIIAKYSLTMARATPEMPGLSQR